MTPPRPLDRLLQRISATEAEEIDCAECFDLLATGVELDLAGAIPTPLQARLALHLGQCAVCQEEYEVLRDLVRSAPVDADPNAGTPPGPVT
jgi:hypothetical protein